MFAIVRPLIWQLIASFPINGILSRMAGLPNGAAKRIIEPEVH